MLHLAMWNLKKHHSSIHSEIGEEVAKLDKLCDEAEWLLDGDTAKETNHMRVLTLSYLLHHLYLREEVFPLISLCRHLCDKN